MDIVVRSIEPTDYPAIHRLFTDPAVIPGTLQLPYPSEEMWRKKLAQPPPGLYGIVACVNNEVVGQLSLITFPNRPRRKHVADLGMAVLGAFHGRGVGTKLMAEAINMAENWLNISRIELTVFTDNAPAIHLYKKFNFEIEGTLVNFAFRDGAYTDVYTMARLRDNTRPVDDHQTH